MYLLRLTCLKICHPPMAMYPVDIISISNSCLCRWVYADISPGLGSFSLRWCKPVIMKMFCKAANFHCSVISMQTHTRLPFTNFKCFVYLQWVCGMAIEFIRFCLLVYLNKSICIFFCVRLSRCSVSTVRLGGGTHTAYTNVEERLYALLCFALVLTPISSTICLCECERVRRCLRSKRFIPVSKWWWIIIGFMASYLKINGIENVWISNELDTFVNRANL